MLLSRDPPDIEASKAINFFNSLYCKGKYYLYSTEPIDSKSQNKKLRKLCTK